MRSFLAVYGGLAVLGPLLAACQRRWPAPEGVPSPWHRGRWVDWAFWLITPLFTGVLTLVVTLWLAIGIASVAGLPVCSGSGLATRCVPLTLFEGAAARWPIAVQAVLVLLLVDLLSYVSHRVRHLRPFWRFHALHHAPVELDWLAAARLHPVDDLLDNTFVMLPVLLLGFDHRLFLALWPALLLHTLYLHAAVDWRLGAWGRWVASPAFHRAHHAVGVEGNYGGILVVWDRLFGTRVAPPAYARLGVGPSGAVEAGGGEGVEPLRRAGVP